MGEELSSELLTWVGQVGGGDVAHVERSLARREGWYVDVRTPDGLSPFFVRVARPGDPLNDPAVLVREAELARRLASSGVAVAAMRGCDPRHHAAVYDRLPGVADITAADPDRQQRVYEHFFEILASVHALDVGALGLHQLDPEAFHRPTSVREAALAGLDRLEADHARAYARADRSNRPSPVATYGMQWLRTHAPTGPLDATLVHGDAGTPNFLYDGDRVTGVIDWEWARLGDPMEDLGNATLHAAFHPSGRWPDLLAHYGRCAGTAVDVERVRYWRAHLAVRSVVALGTATARWDAHDPVVLNLCYRVISDRIACECIAESMGIALQRAPLPFELGTTADLHGVATAILERSVAPALDGAFARGRLREVGLLVAALGREREARAALDDIERGELALLLGHPPDDVGEGWAAVDARIEAGERLDDELLVKTLFARSWREEQLFAPVVSLFPDVELRPLS